VYDDLSVASGKENSFEGFCILDGSEDMPLAFSSETTDKSTSLDDAPNL
jgi:hypothetical protein